MECRVPFNSFRHKEICYGQAGSFNGVIIVKPQRYLFQIQGNLSVPDKKFLRDGLIVLVTAYAGRKIRLVCDNGRFHHTKAVREWLKANRAIIKIFWLPPYCPSLNLIERLWGHLKRTVLANVLFKTMNDLVAAFCRGASQINDRRNKMGFIFYHDDVKRKAA
jgi:transposase